MNHRALIPLVAGALLLAGCQDPYQDRPAPNDQAFAPSPAPSPAAVPLGDERPPSPVAVEAAPPPRGPGARAALRSFCWRWANWDWRSLTGQQRQLARLAVGELADQLEAQAGQAERSGAARRDRLSVRGQIVTIDLQAGQAPGRAVCVTREQEIQAGRGDLSGGQHRVYLAALDRDAQGWGVSRWEPQP